MRTRKLKRLYLTYVTTYKLQWGRVVEDAEVCCQLLSDRPRNGFNGAASLRTRKCMVSVIHSQACLWLQWGRVVEDAEVKASVSDLRNYIQASMGPRR